MEQKKALSISLGSPYRDKTVHLDLLGQEVELRRQGTNGDEKKAYQLFCENDGKVDAFGVGGINLHINTPWKAYPLYSGLKLVKDVTTTPYTDGKGLQQVLESTVMQKVEKRLQPYLKEKTAFLVEGASRYGMILSFLNAGYEIVFGDLMFALGIPIPINSLKSMNRVIRILMPVVGRLPISMLYSTGESQKENIPKYEKYFKEASVIAGDFLYIKKHIPLDMEGKIIVTNTTTPEDVEFLKSRGVKALITTTPVIEGRSFGTNALESALIAAAGKGRTLTEEELLYYLSEAGIEPTLRELQA